MLLDTYIKKLSLQRGKTVVQKSTGSIQSAATVSPARAINVWKITNKKNHKIHWFCGMVWLFTRNSSMLRLSDKWRAIVSLSTPIYTTLLLGRIEKGNSSCYWQTRRSWYTILAGRSVALRSDETRWYSTVGLWSTNRIKSRRSGKITVAAQSWQQTSCWRRRLRLGEGDRRRVFQGTIFQSESFARESTAILCTKRYYDEGRVVSEKPRLPGALPASDVEHRICR